jgi:hypothetical protein
VKIKLRIVLFHSLEVQYLVVDNMPCLFFFLLLVDDTLKPDEF